MTTARKLVKRGFTLIETVTTVGIIAAMAAVVIPQVVRQFDNADPTRIQSDLKSLQSAIETFHLNIRTTYPGDLDDLSNPLSVTTDSGLTAASPVVLFTATEAPLWQGPYVDFAITEASAGATRPTGYGALILDNFVCYNATQNIVHATAANPACAAATVATDRLFLAVRVTGITSGSAAFTTINDRFDGTTETIRADEGRVRMLASGITYFLALPLN